MSLMKSLRCSLLCFCGLGSLVSLDAPLSAQQGGGPTPNLVVVLMTGFNPSSNPGLAILNAKLQTAFGSLEPGLLCLRQSNSGNLP